MLEKIKEKLRLVWRKVCDFGLMLKSKIKQVLVITGIIGIAIAAGDATKNEVSLEKLATKYEASQEIKAKYQIDGASLKSTIKSDPRDKIGVVLGDSSFADFEPTMELKRWDEVKIKITPTELLKDVDKSDKTLDFNGEKIEFGTNELKINLYTINTDDGGYEYEVVFKSKPKTNVVSLDIESENLEFFYQPELTQDEKNRGSYRPENVIGSYAVYHKTKGVINDINGNNYNSGKAFHIYRPEIIDANNNRVWGELNISNGKLTITIPQDFLDKAIYPVVVDPTFGYSGVGASSDNSSDWLYYGSYSPTNNGLVVSTAVYGRSTVGEGFFKTGFYTEANSLVVELHSGLFPLTTPDWVTTSNFYTGQNYSVASGTSYRLTISLSTSTEYFYYDSGSGTAHYYSAFTFNDDTSRFPSSPSWSSLDTRRFSYYINYNLAIDVITGASTDISSTTAKLNASLDIKTATSVNVYWEYGTSTSITSAIYSASTTPINFTASSTNASTTQTGLQTLKIYHNRAMATSVSGNNDIGDNQWFLSADKSTSSDSQTEWGLGLSDGISTTTLAGSIVLSSNFAYATNTEGWESGNATPTTYSTWVWSSGGNQVWTTTTSAPYAGTYNATAKDALTDNQSSWIDLNYTCNATCTIEWYWKVSSESNYDFLCFCKDIDGTCSRTVYSQYRISGTVAWTRVSTTTGAGAHSFRWIYAKDTNTSNGLDVGQLDAVSIRDYLGSYSSTGTWISVPLPMTGMTNGNGSVIYWSTTTPASTTAIIYTAVTDSTSTPSTWATTTNSGAIADITGDLSAKYLWSKVDLTTTNTATTPQVDWLVYGLNSYGGGGEPPATTPIDNRFFIISKINK